MRAILSDIHGNLEALEAVLADMASFGVQEVFCLGDLVGYGADPIACVEHAMAWPVVLLGNFDLAAMQGDDLEGWTAHAAKRSIFKFRQRLLKTGKEATVGAFLRDLPYKHVDGQALYLHGSPRDPVNEYLFPEDIYNPRKLDAVSQGFERLCFCGHTHVPGIFYPHDEQEWAFLSPEQCDYQYQLGPGKTICNVGSVGQPRDGDPRPSYVLLEEKTINFRRVDYDIEKSIQKINDDDDDPDGLSGARLRDGR